MEFLASISTAFVKGGLWMWIILGIQLASIAIIIERTIFLFVKNKITQRKAVDGYEKGIRKGELEDIKTQSLNSSEPVGKVVASGVEAAMNWGGKDEIRGKMDEVLLDVNSQYEKRTSFLAMLGNVATLTGLLGTITGMIKSFTAVSTASPMEKATLLSSGISEAMNTTAYGLIVAIPALIAFALLANRANQLSEDLNQAALKAYNWLSYSYDPAERAVEIQAAKKPKATSAEV